MSETKPTEPVQLELPIPNPFDDVCDCDACKHREIAGPDGKCGALDCVICDYDNTWDLGGEG